MRFDEPAAEAVNWRVQAREDPALDSKRT